MSDMILNRIEWLKTVKQIENKLRITVHNSFYALSQNSLFIIVMAIQLNGFYFLYLQLVVVLNDTPIAIVLLNVHFVW